MRESKQNQVGLPAPFFLLDEAGAQSKKTPDPHLIPMCWVNCVRVLSYAYVLVSRKDPLESERCSLDGVLIHLASVEAYARMGSKAGFSLHATLVETEISIRQERHRISQMNPSLSLTDTIDLAPKSQIWPMKHQFSTRRDNPNFLLNLSLSCKEIGT